MGTKGIDIFLEWDVSIVKFKLIAHVVPGVSMELCGGTHVSNTSELRGFKIMSQQGRASGVRRIEAVAGEAFIDYISNETFMLCS
ncbi:hypothetical protein Sjap_009799 [Stephania japonica]|uniref:Threonyl/alanyl tRNA synthetase SAD domain-containing protein n=1 Tax=Stephania japonica TaxID=461633 RepID=A0AAP0J7T3_9MAGN